MDTSPALLAPTAAALRSGGLNLATYIMEACDRIDATEGRIQALLPETGRRERLLQQAAELEARYPDRTERPPLYGVLVGVKDIFRVQGFETRAGSKLPPELFAGPEAESVTILKNVGALILGKTVTTEFAYFEPGPTRSPRDPERTPGGSSSGSAAAVAAGYCPLALGTQTVGSVIRPAAFCGIVGFKPTYGRISTAGVLPFSGSADHVGLFTQDVAGMSLGASVLCRGWNDTGTRPRLPVLGVPEGPYLEQASPQGLAAFRAALEHLDTAGLTIRTVPTMEDIEAINRRHQSLIAAEMASVHDEWFANFESLYRPRTAELIREGRNVGQQELAMARGSREALRDKLVSLMESAGIDIWVSPAAVGPAPRGIESTGDPAMNLPWTHAGLPTITLPAGQSRDGLPYGLQCSAAPMRDELLLDWAEELSKALEELGQV